jgi:hypothetical protein
MTDSPACHVLKVLGRHTEAPTNQHQVLALDV